MKKCVDSGLWVAGPGDDESGLARHEEGEDGPDELD